MVVLSARQEKNGNKRTKVESEEAAALKASQRLRVVIVARALFGLCPPSEVAKCRFPAGRRVSRATRMC